MVGAVTAYIGLGANIGAPEAQLRNALGALATLPESRLVRHSSLYRSPPWGVEAQPAFLNAVAELVTTLAPLRLLDGLLRIERDAGRERGERWGPRTLDLDLLLFGDLVQRSSGLTVPHPHLHQRAFVLVPLAEIAPALTVPGRGALCELLRTVDCAGVEALV